MPTPTNIKWICNTSAEEGIAAVKRLMAKPITLETLRTLQAAEQYESCSANRRVSLHEALIRAVRKASSQLTAQSTEKLTKGPKRTTQPGLALKGESTGPDWSRARMLVEGIKLAFRVSLAGQILLGMELLTLKTELGFCGRGGDRRSKPHDAVLKSLNRTWEQWCKAELGMSPDSADRLIETYEAAKSKLKKLGGQPKLIGLLDTSPAKLDDEARKVLSTLVDKIEWGDSQKALLEEFRLVKQHAALAGGDTSKSKKDKSEIAQQLAFAFFSPIPATITKLEKTFLNLRHGPDYKAFLMTLPLTSSRDGEISLTSLESTLKAAIEGDLAKTLEDIRAAKEARMQPQA